jgi:hypothetical protein
MVALLLGLGVALLVPLFFLSLFPAFRSATGLLWLGGAGFLMGLAAYGHRRAAAYIAEEPNPGDLFRPWRLLNPARYEATGRPFVRLQIAAAVLLAPWWLAGPLWALRP